MDLEIFKSTTYFEDTTDISKTGNEGIWETQPIKEADIDLYYEASSSIPMFLDSDNISSYAPIGSKVLVKNLMDGTVKPDINYYVTGHSGTSVLIGSDSEAFEKRSYGIFEDFSLEFVHQDGTITRAEIDEVGKLEDGEFTKIDRFAASIHTPTNSSSTQSMQVVTTEYNNIEVGAYITGSSGPITFSNTYVTAKLANNIIQLNKPIRGFVASGDPEGIWVYNYGGAYKLNVDVYKQAIDLPWFNCYSFGNGVESNRIRDDYNSPIIGSGFKASTVLPSYSREYKTNGLIYSGIYNSMSSENRLNEFNAGIKITKDINPSYGSIQALKMRDTNLNVFTEDRVLKVLANKDALYNADGNTNITSTDSVLGQTVPYVGDFGISKNPESLAHDQYRSYFTDKQRGAVLRLSADGLTPISSIGMKTWFRNNLRTAENLIGDFDVVNGEYNLTVIPNKVSQLSPSTVSFNEASKGWVSFKSYIPDSSISVSGRFLTAKNGKIWEHYSDAADRNTFYNDYGSELIVNSFFNEDLRGWDFSDANSRYISRSVDSPSITSPTLHINGLQGLSAGAVSQDLSTRTERGKKYLVSFDYYIVHEGTVVKQLYLTVDSGSEYSRSFWDQNVWSNHSFVFDSPNKLLKSISFHGATDKPINAYVTNVSVREYDENFNASKLTLLLNDLPGSVKNFKTINLEGSESKSININNQQVLDVNNNTITVNDNSYGSLSGQPVDGYGWSATINTDLQNGDVIDFKNKENKWYGNVVGSKDPSVAKPDELNIDDLSTQGLGFAKSVTTGDATEVQITITQ
jgi:hypothetical protein